MMVINDCEQGSPEWFRARLGIPTASEFSKIITGTGKASTQAGDYMNRLLAEWLAGEHLEAWEGNQWTERGKELEEEARSYYEMTKNVDVVQVGFVTNDIAGCSPDGLVGEDGGVEIKGPSPGVHVSYLLADKLPTIHIPQIQGSMWILDRDWWDFISYHPVLDKLVIRVHRDGKYISLLSKAVQNFTDKMLEKKHQLQKLGYTA